MIDSIIRSYVQTARPVYLKTENDEQILRTDCNVSSQEKPEAEQCNAHLPPRIRIAILLACNDHKDFQRTHSRLLAHIRRYADLTIVRRDQLPLYTRTGKFQLQYEHSMHFRAIIVADPGLASRVQQGEIIDNTMRALKDYAIQGGVLIFGLDFALQRTTEKMKGKGFRIGMPIHTHVREDFWSRYFGLL